MPCVDALGVITVIIVPDSGAEKPTPSAGLLRYAGARLERRRIIGSRIVVTGPEYVEVSVHARVKAFPGAGRDIVRRKVLESLDRFFSPMSWPFGRDVYRSEVLQAIDGTEGVDYVASLELAANNCPPRCGNICMPATALVAAADHEIEVLA
jgi:phage-related baseplate assembly protein